jgi:CRP-like cAMP-binding protein/ribonuclease BN (tRNA processing enzyme)
METSTSPSLTPSASSATLPTPEYDPKLRVPPIQSAQPVSNSTSTTPTSASTSDDLVKSFWSTIGDLGMVFQVPSAWFALTTNQLQSASSSLPSTTTNTASIGSRTSLDSVQLVAVSQSMSDQLGIKSVKIGKSNVSTYAHLRPAKEWLSLMNTADLRSFAMMLHGAISNFSITFSEDNMSPSPDAEPTEPAQPVIAVIRLRHNLGHAVAFHVRATCSAVSAASGSAPRAGSIKSYLVSLVARPVSVFPSSVSTLITDSAFGRGVYNSEERGQETALRQRNSMPLMTQSGMAKKQGISMRPSISLSQIYAQAGEDMKANPSAFTPSEVLENIVAFQVYNDEIVREAAAIGDTDALMLASAANKSKPAAPAAPASPAEGSTTPGLTAIRRNSVTRSKTMTGGLATLRESSTLDASSDVVKPAMPSPPVIKRSLSSFADRPAPLEDLGLNGISPAAMNVIRRRRSRLASISMGSANAAPAASNVIRLPRGGFVVKTSKASIQIGMPPETVKDSMTLGLTVPSFYVIPHELFNRAQGINVAEFEFPAYFNFFVLRRRVTFICQAEQEALIRAVLQETLFGPRPENMTEFDNEFLGETAVASRPNMKLEGAVFARNPWQPTKALEVDTLVEFVHFKDGRAVVIEDVHVVNTGSEFLVLEGGQELFRTDVIMDLPLPYQQFLDPHMRPPERILQTVFSPPIFGVTFLGTSHGFDAKGTTTGFVLWINQRGYMVDPPPHSSLILKMYGIAPVLIVGVILTHCHADHDAGTFHKILEENRLSVFTTATIMGSFLRKYSAISGISIQRLRMLYEFRAVRIGEPMNLHGSSMKFFYALHTIPCIGFECTLGTESLVYSADTLNDPPRIKQMQADGVLSEARAQSLLNFPWHHSLILHEAGVPPIHTPMSTFKDLPEEVKKRLYLVHIAAKDVPTDIGVKAAHEGVEHTLLLPAPTPAYLEAINILDLISSIDLFKSFPARRMPELLTICERLTFAPGSVVMHEGQTDGSFFIISSGYVESRKPDGRSEFLSTGQYFGVRALLSDEPLQDKRIALTECVCVGFQRHPLIRLLSGTEVLPHMRRLMESRKSDVEDGVGSLIKLVASNSIFSKIFHPNQRNLFGSYLERRTVKMGELVMRAHRDQVGAALDAFLFESGTMRVDITQASLETRADLTRLNIAIQAPIAAAAAAAAADEPLTTSSGKKKKKGKPEAVAVAVPLVVPAAGSGAKASSDLLWIGDHLELNLKRGMFVCDWHALLESEQPVRFIFYICNFDLPNNSLFRCFSLLQIMNIIAMSDCVVYSISKQSLLNFFEFYPGLMIQFLNTLYFE